MFIPFSCNQITQERHKETRGDSLTLKISLKPAFYEHSETMLFKSDSLKFIQILLRNYIGADRTQDTFWFRKVYLDNKQFDALESSLIKTCSQKLSQKDRQKGVDGMTISSKLINRGDTNFISFWNPTYNEDSIGYFFSDSIFKIVPSIFKDSLITEYFNELEEYIDNSKSHHADAKRKIDQLRMKKYNWKIEGKSSK